MPLNDYECPVCETVYSDCLEVPVCCNAQALVYFGNWKTLNTQSAYLDNHFYGNGQDVYDEGLGESYRSRGQRQAIMDRLGVTDAPDKEEAMVRKPKPAPSTDDMAEALERAAIKVRDNDIPPETPTPDTYHDAGFDTGYDTQEFV